MKTTKFNKKRITAFFLSFLLVMQQSLAYQVIASEITNADGSPIYGVDNTWNVGPDAVNGQVGFKQFGKIDLDQGHVLNFIYNYIKQQNVDVSWTEANNTHSIHLTPGAEGSINTFVALVNSGVNINGIVNALQSINGGLKTNGNLMFITPGGMAVGASGVLNVGSLSVITPTQTSYKNLTDYLELPAKSEGRLTSVTITENNPATQGKYTLNKTYSDSVFIAKDTSKTFNINTLTDGAGNVLKIDSTKAITVDNGGKIAARGDVTLNAGTVGINGILVAGVNDSTVINTHNAAETLFDNLVNKADNMNTGNGFANVNGNIVITSNAGTSVGNGAKVRNYASNSNITITNTGANGVSISGEVSNPNGNLTVNNKAGQLLVNTGAVVKNKGTMTFTNDVSGTKLALNGTITNTGNLVVTNNSGSNGLLVAGNVTNNTGTATFTNKAGQLLVDTTGRITSKGSSLLVENYNAGNMDIKGQVKNTNSNASVKFINKDSDMKLGSAGIDYNIDSNAKVKIEVTNGNLLNNGVAKTLIRTTNKANLDIDVTNGAIGKEAGPCKDGVCIGIGTDARDLTKSVNTNIAGNIKATSTKDSNASLINMASLDTDMRVDQISAEGRVILLADGSGNLTNSGTKTNASGTYNIVNKASNPDNPNVEGTGISLIASGNIGESNNALTFRQNGVSPIFTGDDARNPHVLDAKRKPEQGVDMLAIGNINVKGKDAAGGSKVNTNVCAMISRTGDINAEFSGDTYIGETTAQKSINITTRGKNLYIDNLGQVPSYENDYYGPNANVVPEKAKLVALDLGTNWSNNPDYRNAADSTIVVKNGTINGKGIGRINSNGSTNHEQDLTLVADNAYAGGYYFNMGKHRGQTADGKFNPSTVVKDDGTTDPIKTPAGKEISIRGKAVRPDDLDGVDTDETRNFYYGGSEQGFEDGYDGVKNGDDYVDNPSEDEQGKENDDDNLVVPEEEGDGQLDNDTDTDTDTDIDMDTDSDMDNDLDSDTDTDTDNDNDMDNDTDTDSDTDNDTDTDSDIDNDTDTDTDTDIDTDTDSDADNDLDSDTDTDTDNDNDMDNDTDTDADTDMDNDTDTDSDTDNDTDTDMDTDNDTDTDTDTDNDTDTDADADNDLDSDTDTDTDNDNDMDNDTDTDADTDMDNDTDTDADTDNDTDTDTDSDNNDAPIVIDFKDLYKQRVVTDRVDSIDKRQYMRFGANDNQNVVAFESSNDVIAITDISRGGVSLKHNKKLKVGDIVPVHLKYGDLEINANAKIVSASDVKAGAQFIDLDQATANKLLYLSLLQKDEPIAQTIMNISTTSIDD